MSHQSKIPSLCYCSALLVDMMSLLYYFPGQTRLEFLTYITSRIFFFFQKSFQAFVHYKEMQKGTSPVLASFSGLFDYMLHSLSAVWKSCICVGAYKFWHPIISFFGTSFNLFKNVCFVSCQYSSVLEPRSISSQMWNCFFFSFFFE